MSKFIYDMLIPEIDQLKNKLQVAKKLIWRYSSRSENYFDANINFMQSI